MDVENVKLVDGLVFGYLGRRQYHETLRALCNEAPSLRDDRHRFQSGGDIFIQVNDQLHDKNLEQIINAFAVVGRFDITPELVDFGIRLRDLTNEFSTMTAVRGRSVSDNQMKLYGKRVFSKQPTSRASQSSNRSTSSQSLQQCQTVYCLPHNANGAEYGITSAQANAQQHSLSQQEYGFDYQSQPHGSTFTIPATSYVAAHTAPHNSNTATAQENSSSNVVSYQITDQSLSSTQPAVACERPMLIDYGVDVKDSQLDLSTTQCTRTETSEEHENVVQPHICSSFSSESGAHKRKAAIPHRRDELVAHTAQSLIVPNGVLLDLEADALASSTSQISLLSNIDDSAMQCLDRLINGNLDEVFPFCEDHGDFSGFGDNMEYPLPSNQANDHDISHEGNETLCCESAPPPLDVGPSHSSAPAEAHSSKSRSLDEGEIISEESLHEKSDVPTSVAKTVARSEEFETNTRLERSPSLRSDSRRSSLDSGKNRRDERRPADRLKDFNRNPPKSDHRSRKATAERFGIHDAVIRESSNVPRVSPPSSGGGRLSRDRARGFSSLFDGGPSNPSSRDSSPHHEKINKKEEERRRREKEMEKERQRDKERLKRQRRDRHRESERPQRLSPDQKSLEKKSYRGGDEDKARDLREKEKKREQTEERRIVDEVEKRKSEEKSRREMLKKKKEEEQEARRQAELQRRNEAMRRKDEEERKRRQEEKERQEEKRREEEKRHLEEEKQRKREEDRLRREEEKAQRRKAEDEKRKEDLREEDEDGRGEMMSEASDVQVTAKSNGHTDQESGDSEEDSGSTTEAVHTPRNDEEATCSRKDLRNQEQKIPPPKPESRKLSGTATKQTTEKDGPQENEDDLAPALENEERKKKVSREEIRSIKSAGEGRKPPPPPVSVRRREEVRKPVIKPLEPGMMMSDPGVLDRINKEMESLTGSSRSRPSSNRSPDESPTVVKNPLPTTRIPKRDTSVDYNQVLFSNPPVIKRTPPAAEKKKNYVISSGLATENVNQMVFSKAHSSRLGMFLEKVSDKHKRLMERDSDRAMVSPVYEDPDRNGVRSPAPGYSQFPRQQQQKFAPQKRPLPATSLESYLGSPPQSPPDIRDNEATSSRSTGKKCKLDLSRMPDIIDKLYGEIVTVLLRRIFLSQHQAVRSFCVPHGASIDERYDALLRETFSTDENVPDHWIKCSSKVTSAHDFMVVHPKVRWGSYSASCLKNPQRQLEEAVTLVNTLSGFRVVDASAHAAGTINVRHRRKTWQNRSAILGVDYNTKRKTVWGTGQIETLVRMKQQSRVTAIMVNVDMLTPLQQHSLFNIFRVPIYDRYNIVLSIFKQYATTPEAHLQIQLAEIPYIRNRLHYLNKYRFDPATLHVERQPERANVDEFEVLRLREQSLRKKLQQLMEKNTGKAVEKTRDAAMVAVVGYTNAGKTSLVKCLTGASSLDPKNRLFATLDTTRHLARLPSGRKVIFTDTIGFLSDLPMHLLAAFQATLSHVSLADIIIHIRDLSNPDWPAQSEDVEKTLGSIGLPPERLRDVVVVDNKIDVNGAPLASDGVRISCKTSEGVKNLIEKVDKMVLRATGCKLRRLSLRCSSPAITYLYKEGFVTEEPASTDSHLIFDVFMNDAEFARFQKSTGSLKRRSS